MIIRRKERTASFIWATLLTSVHAGAGQGSPMQPETIQRLWPPRATLKNNRKVREQPSGMMGGESGLTCLGVATQSSLWESLDQGAPQDSSGVVSLIATKLYNI